MNKILERCTLCPRKCGVNRFKQRGFCGESADVRIARAELHMWEEPPISGQGGAGTVFFTGCTLRCCYCQNYEISAKGKGFVLSTDELYESFVRLIEMGAENIELVTPTQFAPQIIDALDRFGDKRPTVVYNTGGYECPETLEILDGHVDVYLPDLKYFDCGLSEKYSKAPDYFDTAIKAIEIMLDQVGKPVFDERGIMRKGVIIRHMVLPTHRHDSIRLIHELADRFGTDSFLLSLMSQYTPVHKAFDFKELSRRTSSFEYDSVLEAAEEAGLEGFFQERSSADKGFIPEFFDKKYY